MSRLGIPRTLNYDLYFKIEPVQNFFISYGIMTISNETIEKLSQLNILLYHSLKVKSIKDANDESLHFTQEKVSLKDEKDYYVNNIDVKLKSILKPDEKIKLYIEYEGSINGYSHIMGYVKDRVDKDFSILRPDSHAYPIISQPFFESILKSYENTFLYKITIDVPREYTVGCGGVLKEVIYGKSRNIFQYSCEFPTWRFDIGIAQYSLIEDKDMNLKIFAFPEHRDNAENVVKKELKRAFDLFTALFGDYRKDSYFTVIEIKESYGSQAGDNYIMMEEHGFSNDTKKLTHLYHEIGHIWNVKVRYNIQLARFFDEAFASYFEALAIKRFYGDNAFKEKMELYRRYFISEVDRDKINYYTPICEYGKYKIGHNSYTKGPWVLYVLNEVVGDETFCKIIKNFLNAFKDKEADFKDFQRVANETSHIDLEEFFSQWIYGIESSECLYGGKDLSYMIKDID
ncbi:M1 family aminopeptidase [Proteiniborus sp. MB09-C3]|uniref:M1 family aminopeptidase n=1 Tax=Proteiniborus sp. MB09-C3 TaxID=3050072 RepID=UPI002555E97B|nr:M1 family aminopeptidase [Proteiniborus sp. MB09-C3]WIV12383.1 M1 family aminopeptidase [Proteiniborus sp. MB09-C3]